MDVRLSIGSTISHKTITITGSKSETNRLLLLNALYNTIGITNTSESDDSKVMQMALSSGADVIDVHHAGTAMRFLTAYFAQHEGRQIVLTGSSRMKERPIEVLVDALRELGAEIEYLDKVGYPPLKITGKKLQGGKAHVRADVSSQYISALLLIAPKLQQGIELVLAGEITSRPYVDMTLSLLTELNIAYTVNNNVIKVEPKSKLQGNSNIVVESDWSSASYYYAIVALSKPGTSLTLSSYKKSSRQGDSVLPDIFRQLYVHTTFNDDNTITITKGKTGVTELKLDLSGNPDLAQTIAVTCCGLGTSCELYGLHTLKIKETDRLTALQTELSKFGAKVIITNDSLILHPPGTVIDGIEVETYNDHRMALAFAPLAALGISVIIKDAGVVSKSYPAFWDDLKAINFSVKQL